MHRCPKNNILWNNDVSSRNFLLSYSLLQYFRDYNREIIELLRYATSSDCYTVSVIAYRMQYPDVVTTIVIHSATSGVFFFSLIFCVQISIVSNYIFYRLNRYFTFSLTTLHLFWPHISVSDFPFRTTFIRVTLLFCTLIACTIVFSSLCKTLPCASCYYWLFVVYQLSIVLNSPIPISCLFAGILHFSLQLSFFSLFCPVVSVHSNNTSLCHYTLSHLSYI